MRRAAVVAVPLGVLKANAITFQPALPLRKRVAIKALGCALMNKIVLAFDSRFWDTDTSVIGVASDLRAQFSWFLDLHLAFSVDTTPMLMCFLSTAAARATEALSDAAMLDACLQALAACFVRRRGEGLGSVGDRRGAGACAGAGVDAGTGAGAGVGAAAAASDAAGATTTGCGGDGGGGDGAGSCGTPTERGATFKSLGLGSGCETAFTGTDDAATAAAIPTHGLPKLRGYLITRWWRDPFARGSWTFFPPHSVPRHYSDMAAPVASTLFFAGEHTCVAAQGCAHGAFMSGDAAAAQVLHALARQGMAAKGVSGAGKQ